MGFFYINVFPYNNPSLHHQDKSGTDVEVSNNVLLDKTRVDRLKTQKNI